MSDIRQNQAEQQAIRWQAQLSSDLLSDQQRLAFQHWLHECPENAAAWQAVNDFWTGLDKLTLADISDEANGQILSFDKAKTRKPAHPYLKISLALAASLLLMFNVFFQSINFYLADYHSAVGHQQQITLADGSTVLLNTASAFSVNFSEQQRLITLYQGEAYFQVTADSKRPFIVKTDAGQVQALGTAFDIKQQNKQVSVTVFEHAVKITTVSGKIKEKLLKAEQLVFTTDHIDKVTPVNLQRAAAWHQQRMVFQDKPLADVVEELDRYHTGKIIILNNAIKHLPITGVFGIADTDIALQAIEQSLPVKVSKISDKLVLLSAK